MAATKKKSASSCFQHLSAKFALFWFWSHPITKLETDIQKWLWPELIRSDCKITSQPLKKNYLFFENSYVAKIFKTTTLIEQF